MTVFFGDEVFQLFIKKKISDRKNILDKKNISDENNIEENKIKANKQKTLVFILIIIFI